MKTVNMKKELIHHCKMGFNLFVLCTFSIPNLDDELNICYCSILNFLFFNQLEQIIHISLHSFFFFRHITFRVNMHINYFCSLVYKYWKHKKLSISYSIYRVFTLSKIRSSVLVKTFLNNFRGKNRFINVKLLVKQMIIGNTSVFFMHKSMHQ